MEIDTITDEIPEMKSSEVHHGRNIVAFRSLRHWNQSELATRLKLSQQEVSRIERKQVLPEETLAKVANVLGIHVDILKNYTDKCQISIVNENEVTVSDDAQVNLHGGYDEENQQTNNYADKALEVIETVVNNQNSFVEYLKGENEALKAEIRELREKSL